MVSLLVKLFVRCHPHPSFLPSTVPVTFCFPGAVLCLLFHRQPVHTWVPLPCVRASILSLGLAPARPLGLCFNFLSHRNTSLLLPLPKLPGAPPAPALIPSTTTALHLVMRESHLTPQNQVLISLTAQHCLGHCSLRFAQRLPVSASIEQYLLNR